MSSPTKELERLNSKHEKRAGTLQMQDLKVNTARLSWSMKEEYWTPKRSILSLFLVLALFALAGGFAFTNSVKLSTLSYDGFVVSYNEREPKLRHREPLGFASPPGEAPRDQGTVVSPLEEALRDQETVVSAPEEAPRDQETVVSPPGCNEKDAALRVYMYDLPPAYHYGMLSGEFSKGQIWPRKVSDIPGYAGGLYQQHSPEYWLTSDLLTSTMPDRQSVCTAYRVDDWRFADVIFVPFFASLSYNKDSKGPHGEGKFRGLGRRDRVLQDHLVKFLERQPAWRASGGADHVIVIHHPNSMELMREKLRSAMFVVADFGRYAPQVANLKKDVVAPYKYVVGDFDDDYTSFENRTTLMYFQGAIKRKEGGFIRQQLYELLKSEPGVHFAAGNTSSRAIHSSTEGMRGSKFCLNLAGDTPSSNRLFDSIASHCVPVIISDDIELPFEDDLDYSEFCIFVKGHDAVQPGYVINLLRGMSEEQWTRMWKRLQQVAHHFKYQHPTQPDDAVHMTWKAILHKVPTLNLFLNRQRRYRSSRRTELKASKISSLFFHW